MMKEEEINTIRKIVWSYSRSTGLEFDDLYSEACLAYLEAAAAYNPERGKKSTFIWTVVQNHIRIMLKKRKREVPVDVEVIETLLEGREELDPEKIVCSEECWKELLGSFSPEAQTICKLVTSTECEFDAEKPREARGKIAKELRRRGWSHGKIWAAFREIKLKLKNRRKDDRLEPK